MSLKSRLKKELRDFMGSMFSVPSDFLGLGMGMPPSESGVLVTEMTAMQVGAVAACIRIISSAIASTPCEVCERQEDGGFKVAYDHPLYDKLVLQPSPEYTAADFFAASQVHLLQTGNAYIEVLRNNGGQPAELQLRSPYRTFLYRDRDTDQLVYKTSDTPNGSTRIIKPENMVHVKGMGTDPYTGLSPIKYLMREEIGAALAAQAFGARFFKNDARPGGYLKSPNLVAKDKKQENIASWVAGHAGSNAHTVAMLDGGLEWQSVGIAPDEAQFLQTRQFSRSEIGACYGVPVYMIGGEAVESRANTEQKALDLLMWTLKPWFVRWQQAINTKLFPATGRTAGKFFARFDTADYERADYATLLKALQTGRYAGVYTIDEGRKLLGLNPTTQENFDPKKPGKNLLQAVNMATLTEDGLVTAAGATGNGSEDPNADTDPKDDKSKTDEGRAFRGAWVPFQHQLAKLKTRKRLDNEAFQRAFGPLFVGVAQQELPPEAWGEPMPEDVVTYIRSAIEGFAAAWPSEPDATKVQEVISAIVRAAKAHVSESEGAPNED